MGTPTNHAAVIGVPHVAPHDLRRTTAKLCRAAGGELEQNSNAAWAFLGADHGAIPRDEAGPAHAPNDGIKLKLAV